MVMFHRIKDIQGVKTYFKKSPPEVEAITLCQDADILVPLLHSGASSMASLGPGPAFGLNRGLFVGPKKREIEGAEIRTIFVLEKIHWQTWKLNHLKTYSPSEKGGCPMSIAILVFQGRTLLEQDFPSPMRVLLVGCFGPDRSVLQVTTCAWVG